MLEKQKLELLRFFKTHEEYLGKTTSTPKGLLEEKFQLTEAKKHIASRHELPKVFLLVKEI